MRRSWWLGIAVGCLALGLAGPSSASLSIGRPDTTVSNARSQGGYLVAKKGSKKGKGKKKSEPPPSPPVDETPPPPPAPAAEAPSGGGESGGGDGMGTRRGPARVDFDDRLIQGQTNKSGAIYIFERKNSEIHSMVRRRTSFRDEILRSIE